MYRYINIRKHDKIVLRYFMLFLQNTLESQNKDYTGMDELNTQHQFHMRVWKGLLSISLCLVHCCFHRPFSTACLNNI